MSLLYNFQGKWLTYFKNMFEEHMPIKTSMVATIVYNPYFIKTGLFCILKCLTFRVFDIKNVEVTSIKIKFKQNGACLLKNGKCEFHLTKYSMSL